MAGFYWELPDGTQQNRCPRAHIREDPDWWHSIILTYNAYEKGFLPGPGGVDNQPYLLVPIMATISSALNDEDELARQQAERKRDMSAKSRQSGATSGPDYVSLGSPRHGK